MSDHDLNMRPVFGHRTVRTLVVKYRQLNLLSVDSHNASYAVVVCNILNG